MTATTGLNQAGTIGGGNTRERFRSAARHDIFGLALSAPRYGTTIVHALERGNDRDVMLVRRALLPARRLPNRCDLDSGMVRAPSHIKPAARLGLSPVRAVPLEHTTPSGDSGVPRSIEPCGCRTARSKFARRRDPRSTKAKSGKSRRRPCASSHRHLLVRQRLNV